MPVLRLRSNSSGQEVVPSPRKQPPLTSKADGTPLAPSHPVTDIRAVSEPSLQIIRKSIPLGQLKKMEQEHRIHKLADLLVNDMVSGALSANTLSTLGRVDSAFYIERLPQEFKPLAEGLLTPTISSGKLMQRYFAADFRNNVGWNGATSVYANFMQREAEKSSSASSSHVAHDDEATRQAELERMQGAAEVIVRSLLGYPPTVDSSPLPGKLISLLIACDQRVHAKLIGTEMPTVFSTDQIRTGRLAALTYLLGTRLLQPMLYSLATQPPSETEMSFQIMLLQGLMAGIRQLADALFNKSFATSPLALQQQATEKATREKIDARIRRLQAKPSTRHVRTRSADTTPISPRTLRTMEEARSLRKVQKAGELATELESQDWSVLDEANREVDENLAISQARTELQQFDAEDLKELVSLLASDSEAMAIIQPRRAQPLDDSEELPVSAEPAVTADTLPVSSATLATTATTFNTRNTTINSTVTTGTSTDRQPTGTAAASVTSGQAPQPAVQQAVQRAPQQAAPQAPEKKA